MDEQMYMYVLPMNWADEINFKIVYVGSEQSWITSDEVDALRAAGRGRATGVIGSNQSFKFPVADLLLAKRIPLDTPKEIEIAKAAQQFTRVLDNVFEALYEIEQEQREDGAADELMGLMEDEPERVDQLVAAYEDHERILKSSSREGLYNARDKMSSLMVLAGIDPSISPLQVMRKFVAKFEQK